MDLKMTQIRVQDIWLQTCSNLKRKPFLNQNGWITFPSWDFFRMLFVDPNVRKLGYNIIHSGDTNYFNLGSEYARFGCDNIPKITHISPILCIGTAAKLFEHLRWFLQFFSGLIAYFYHLIFVTSSLKAKNHDLTNIYSTK